MGSRAALRTVRGLWVSAGIVRLQSIWDVLQTFCVQTASVNKRAVDEKSTFTQYYGRICEKDETTCRKLETWQRNTWNVARIIWRAHMIRKWCLDNLKKAKYLGPYIIGQRVNAVNYIIKMPRHKTQLCHINRLKGYVKQAKGKPIMTVLEVNWNDKEDYSVERT